MATYNGNANYNPSPSACEPFTVVPRSLVTDSALCTFDIDSGVAGAQFRLIYTQDPYAPTKYKLTASNPGQFYYNVFYTNAGPGNDVTFTLVIPFPYVTQGATPIHVYDTVTMVQLNGQTCLLPGNEIYHASQYIFLGNGYDSMGKTATLIVTVPASVVPDTGTVYLNIHLDYGEKKVGGWSKTAKSAGTCPVPLGKSPSDSDDADNSTGVIICNFQQYTFSYSAVDGSGAQGDSPTVMSENVFKNDPGIAGLVVDAWGTPVPNVKVEIWQGSEWKVTLSTDENGFYMWAYKYGGKPTTFTVRLPDTPGSDGNPMERSFIFKSNGFAVVNFHLPSWTPEIASWTEVFAKWL